MSNLIDRQAAIDEIRKDVMGGLNYESILKRLPSAQPELDEWCTDCKEYDQKRHCCPRFRRVIREVAEEVRQTELPEPHYCRECKWSWCHINVGKHGEIETYWRCLNWDGETDEEGYCHEWERRTDESSSI